MGIGDWGLGIGDWGLGIGPNPQSPIPNPQSPIPIFMIKQKHYLFLKIIFIIRFKLGNEKLKYKYYNEFLLTSQIIIIIIDRINTIDIFILIITQ